MRIGVALRELHRSESALSAEFLRVAGRHPQEHEVRHVAGDLAAWSRDHVLTIAGIAPRYGVEPDGPGSPEPSGEGRELPGEESDADLLLLADLRRLYRMSAGVALDWDLLGQGARVVGDSGLIEVTRRCAPRSVRRMRWARGMLRALSPQILAG
ncbi:hypothetical protein ACFVWN_04245 [Nocardiopsis flavescens]|uniref:Uncharacterized protein n=1 Tax=Nocardiopsis flavescens TaxID=758803 RepID=A0A1M6LVZ7_9ACTN|nr:hypothetical protein [Nocardiopsis flavescens]SHJ75325.1 hypothetical protein SAMN05421803_10979 [Nocardiopsis flavescens]